MVETQIFSWTSGRDGLGPVFFPKTGNSPPAEVALHSLKHTIIRKLKEKEMNIVSCPLRHCFPHLHDTDATEDSLLL